MIVSTLFDTKTVQVLCSCKEYLPLCRTYFCRYCYQIRCLNCITHEVDCYYCPSCLETMASGEANARKDKCTNCYDCPSCGNVLSLRASVIQVPKVDDSTKVELQKLYYGACSFCRWTTRESNIPDKKSASNAWPPIENSYEKTVKTLIESFNKFATREKMEKERSKYASRKNYFFLMDSGSSGRRRYSTQMRINKRHSEVDRSPIELPAQEAVETINDIDEYTFAKPFFIEDVMNIEQRLRDPERQPQSIKDLYPICKQILVKRSMRCRKCDHNLCKPEIAPNSIRFKINLGSIYHVPEIKIRPLSVESDQLEFNKPKKMILTVTNPAHRTTTVKFSQIIDSVDELSTAKIELPACDLKIGAKNEILGFDDIDNGSSEFDGQDDPLIVSKRKANKLEFFVTVTPMKSHGPIISCIQLTFDYKDPTSHLTTRTSTDSSTGTSANVNEVSLRMVTYRLEFGCIHGEVLVPGNT